MDTIANKSNITTALKSYTIEDFHQCFFSQKDEISRVLVVATFIAFAKKNNLQELEQEIQNHMNICQASLIISDIMEDHKKNK